MDRFPIVPALTASLVLLSTAALSAAAFAGPPAPEDQLAAAQDFAERVRESMDRVIPDDVREIGPRDVFIDVGRGPVPVRVPVGYDPSESTPVIFLLHGYQTTAAEIEAWWQLSALADEFGFLYVRPQGESDIFGNPFWNATNACCDLFGENPDDSAYLLDVLNEVKAQWNVDPRRVYFAGHSNGGFMSYRMACDYPEEIAAVASLAGATWLDPAQCSPAEPVHVLQIHGTSDNVIQYGGGCIPFGGCHPGAVETVEQWAQFDGCDPTPQTGPPMLDLTIDIAGPDAEIARYESVCQPGGSAELWTIPGGVHSPDLSSTFSRQVVEFLFAHPKPSACPADLTGDDAVNSDDLFQLLGAWGACTACPADLTGDGEVNSDDLFELLGAWGSCTGP